MTHSPLASKLAEVVHAELCGCPKWHRAHGDTYIALGRTLRDAVEQFDSTKVQKDTSSVPS